MKKLSVEEVQEIATLFYRYIKMLYTPVTEAFTECEHDKELSIINHLLMERVQFVFNEDEEEVSNLIKSIKKEIVTIASNSHYPLTASQKSIVNMYIYEVWEGL